MCIYLVCRRISTGNDCKISQTQYGVTPHLHTELNFMRHSSKQPKLFPVPMLLTSMFLVGIWYFHYHITPNGSDVAMWSCTLYFQQFWLKKPALSTACKQVFYTIVKTTHFNYFFCLFPNVCLRKTTQKRTHKKNKRLLKFKW